MSFEPVADVSHVSSLVHLHVASPSLKPGNTWLFEGTLSSYYLGKLKQGEIADALLARQIPLASWRGEAELIVAPLRALALGTYSLASSAGLVTEFQVTTSPPLLHRLWPAATRSGSPRFAVYCSAPEDASALPDTGVLVFEPNQLSVALLPGVEDGGPFPERCRHFSSEVQLLPGEIWVPPPALGVWALDPSLFAVAELEPALPLACTAGEVAFGPGCAEIADDRLVVRTPDAGMLWVVHSERGALIEVTRAGAALTVPGLLPGNREHLWGSTHDSAGASLDFDLVVSTAAARARPILNEVLADALGPEPQSEWLELYNDGALAVDLGGYSLQDGGGRTPLPHAWLAAKEYALLVREDFVPNGSDEPPAPGTRLIRLPALGKSGLSNSGERLALLDSAGVERSVLPALSGKPGQSLARQSPASSDDDPHAFGFGVATPGAANDSAR